MSRYFEHAEREFRAAKWKTDEGFDDEMQKMICNNVLDLLRVFASQGHSGSSAPYAINMFKKLAFFEPLVPLTGEDSEWNEIGTGKYQNNRCSHVFKDGGNAYDIDGKVFICPSGGCYTSKDSHVPVTFPYTPKTVYINVDDEGEPVD